MAASLVRRVLCQRRYGLCFPRMVTCSQIVHSSETNDSGSGKLTSTPGVMALNKFDKIVEDVVSRSKEVQLLDEKSKNEIPVNESFASMLRNSKLVSLGEYDGRLLKGKIIEVMDNDLYIDFGGKFHCVCPRPQVNGEKYRRGTSVLITLRCLEMSSSFLGSDIHVTLLEGDATLRGLDRSGPERTPRLSS